MLFLFAWPFPPSVCCLRRTGADRGKAVDVVAPVPGKRRRRLVAVLMALLF